MLASVSTARSQTLEVSSGSLIAQVFQFHVGHPLHAVVTVDSNTFRFQRLRHVFGGGAWLAPERRRWWPKAAQRLLTSRAERFQVNSIGVTFRVLIAVGLVSVAVIFLEVGRPDGLSALVAGFITADITLQLVGAISTRQAKPNKLRQGNPYLC